MNEGNEMAAYEVREVKGWLDCVIINIMIITGLIITISGVLFLTPLEFNAVWGLIEIGLTGMSLVYFGRFGFRTIPLGNNGVPVLFGKRQSGFKLSEGLVWYFPAPIGRVEAVPVVKQLLDQPASQALALDNIIVTGNLSSEIEVEDPCKYVVISDAKELYKKAMLDAYRSTCSRLNATTIPHAKNVISEILLEGTTNGTEVHGLDHIIGVTPGEKDNLKNIGVIGVKQHALQEWGIKVNKIQIEEILLPSEITTARAQEQVERAQRTSETTELSTLADIIAGLRLIFPQLSDKDLAVQARVIQGKQVSTIDMNSTGTSLENAGALAGGILNNQTGG